MTGIRNNEIWYFWLVEQPKKAQLRPGIALILHSYRANEIPNRWPTDVKVDIISNVN